MKIAMLFPGYGSQFVGMGKELYDESRIMQEYFEEASVCLPINFVKLCFASSDAELGKSVHASPALFLICISVYEILKKEGIKPDIVSGYLGGEYMALYAAGCISFPDGLYLLHKYATLYQELLGTGDFMALRVSGIVAKKLQALCKEVHDDALQADIALYEGSQDFVVTGHAQALEQIRYKAREIGASIKNVSVEIGLHSSLMQPVAAGLKMYLEKVDFKDAHTPFISCLDGKVVQKAKKVRDFIIANVIESVRWDKVLKELSDYDVILEIGPASSITTQIAALYPDKKIMTIIKPADIKMLKQLLASPVQEVQAE
jgi:[acyl-carrier-protein] S-malonyltransferase